MLIDSSLVQSRLERYEYANPPHQTVFAVQLVEYWLSRSSGYTNSSDASAEQALALFDTLQKADLENTAVFRVLSAMSQGGGHKACRVLLENGEENRLSIAILMPCINTISKFSLNNRYRTSLRGAYRLIYMDRERRAI